MVQSAYLKIWLNLKQIATESISLVSCTLYIDYLQITRKKSPRLHRGEIRFFFVQS